MRSALLGMVTLIGCTPEVGTVEAGGLTVSLVVPGDVDPLDGADTLRVRLLDRNGGELEVVEGGVDETPSLGDLTHYGVVQVEVTALADDGVLSAARTGPVVVGDEEATEISAFFLPVNTAVRLDDQPNRSRIDHHTLQTPDGRVLLVGGRKPSSSTVWDNTEWWDPDLGFDGSGPDLPSERYDMAATRIGDGEWLLSGGYDTTGSGADPTDTTFRIALDGRDIDREAALEQARAGHCMATVHSAAVAAMGGTGNEESISMELFKKETDGEFAWSLVTMNDLVTGEVSGCVGTTEGRVVTVGLTDDAWGVLDLSDDATVEPADAYTQLKDTQSSLEGPLMVPLSSGEVWVGGGASSGRVVSSGREIDPSARKVESGTPLDEPRAWGHWRWYDEEAQVLAVAGGFADDERSEPVTSIEILDLVDGGGISIELEVNSPRLEVVRGQALLVTGGIDLQVGLAAGSYLIVPWLD